MPLLLELRGSQLRPRLEPYMGNAPLSPQATDNELAARALGGDGVAFECIMRRHDQMLFRTARSILRSDAEAQDALQEAYLRAWQALASFRADARLSTWLMRIVINESLGRLRKQRARTTPLVSATGAVEDQADATEDNPDQRPESVAMRGQVRRLLEEQIDRLPPAFRIVFMLRAVEELSVAEVALALAIPEATVRTRFLRARNLLRKGLSLDLEIAAGDAFPFAGARCDRMVATVLANLADGQSPPRRPRALIRR